MLKIYQLRLQQNTYDVTLKYRGVGVRVAFVDGNTYNGTPAKCYTNDPFKQRAIEASQLFKDKDIVLERQVEEESDKKPQRTQPTAEAPKNKPASQEQINKISFDNLGEAIQFVASKFGIVAKSEAEARRILKENGYTPTIKK